MKTINEVLNALGVWIWTDERKQVNINICKPEKEEVCTR